MHEISIVKNICATLEDFAAENNLTKIGRVTLTLGEVSGVVPHYLTDAWGWFTKKSELLVDSRLEIEFQKAHTRCNACGEIYSTLTYAKICPKCHSEDTVLVDGLDIEIKEIEAL